MLMNVPITQRHTMKERTRNKLLSNRSSHDELLDPEVGDPPESDMDSGRICFSQLSVEDFSFGTRFAQTFMFDLVAGQSGYARGAKCRRRMTRADQEDESRDCAEVKRDTIAQRDGIILMSDSDQQNRLLPPALSTRRTGFFTRKKEFRDQA